MKDKIIENIKNNMFYDYIYENYYLLSKEDLKTILLEYIYIFIKAKEELEETSAYRAEELEKFLLKNIEERL